MKIIINKKAEEILKQVKKQMVCSDSTAILLLYEFAKLTNRNLKRVRTYK